MTNTKAFDNLLYLNVLKVHNMIFIYKKHLATCNVKKKDLKIIRIFF